MARPARKRTRPDEHLSSGGEKFLGPDERLILTVFLRHRLTVKRRPGSAIDFAELTRRVTLRELRADRLKKLKRSIEKVRRFAKRQNMTVKAVDILGRSVTLKATAAAAERAFSTRLLWLDDDGDRRYFPRRAPSLPKQLKPYRTCSCWTRYAEATTEQAARRHRHRRRERRAAPLRYRSALWAFNCRTRCRSAHRHCRAGWRLQPR